jgi:hypothetical protein
MDGRRRSDLLTMVSGGDLTEIEPEREHKTSHISRGPDV